MNKFLYLVIFLTLTLTLKARSNITIKDTSRCHLSAGFSLLSSHDINPLQLGYFFILQQTDSKIKARMDKILDRQGMMHFGEVSGYDIKADFRLKNVNNYRLLVLYSWKYWQNLNLPATGYRLIRDGNYELAGMSVNLSGSDYSVSGYQIFGIGVQQKSDKFSSEITLNYLNQRFDQQLTLNDSYFYTSDEGDSVELSIDAAYQKAIRTNAVFGKTSGSGLSFNAGVVWHASEKHKISLNIENLGVVHEKVQKTSVDTLLTLKGMDVFGGQLFEQYFPSGLADSFINTVKPAEDHWTLSSYSLNFQYAWQINDRMNTKLSANYFPAFCRNPSIEAVASYSFSENKIILSSGLARDYFGHYGWLLGLNFHLKTWTFDFSSKHFQSLITPVAVGQSIIFSFGKKF